MTRFNPTDRLERMMRWYWVTYTILLSHGTQRGDGGRTATHPSMVNNAGRHLTLEQMLSWREQIRREAGAPDSATIIIDNAMPMSPSDMSRAEDAKWAKRRAELEA